MRPYAVNTMWAIDLAGTCSEGGHVGPPLLWHRFEGGVGGKQHCGVAGVGLNVVGTAIGVSTTSTGEFTLGGIEPGTRRLRVMRLGYEATLS